MIYEQRLNDTLYRCGAAAAPCTTRAVPHAGRTARQPLATKTGTRPAIVRNDKLLFKIGSQT